MRSATWWQGPRRLCRRPATRIFIAKATTPLCRRLHALLLADGPATADTLAVKVNAHRDTVGKRLTRLLHAGFASAEMTSLGRQGRTFTYTATAKPMPPELETWSERRWRVYDAINELESASLGSIHGHTRLTKNTVNQHLLRLLRDEYIERIPHPTHARRGTYQITGREPPLRA